MIRDALLTDLRYAARLFARAPAWTAVAAISLTLGIAANLLIFSIVDAVLLRPFPYRDPSQLVFLRRIVKEGSELSKAVLSNSLFNQCRQARARFVSPFPGERHPDIALGFIIGRASVRVRFAGLLVNQLSSSACRFGRSRSTRRSVVGQMPVVEVARLANAAG